MKYQPPDLLPVEGMVLGVLRQGGDAVESPAEATSMLHQLLLLLLLLLLLFLLILLLFFLPHLAIEKVSKISTGLHLAVPQ